MILFIIIMCSLWLAASLHEARLNKAEREYWHRGDRVLKAKRAKAIGDKDVKTRLADELCRNGNPFNNYR